MNLFKLIDFLLKLIYPPKCILCRRLLDELDGDYFCRLCLNEYHQQRPNLFREEISMQKTGSTSSLMAQQSKTDFEENEIETDRPAEIIALFPYSENYRKSILRWKYGGIRKYAKGFGQLLIEEENIFKELKIDLLIPVPLAPSRMRKRGFNQALDLAKVIGKQADIPVWDCLIRTKDTRPQAECKREERYKNIKGSIAFKTEFMYNPVKQVRKTENNKEISHINYIALVDDIYTTGSTAKECIQVLKRQAVFKDAQIIMLVVGKGDF